jgi:signal transduction histidine kinase/DNA-binding response OmpR family regulator
MIRNYLWILLFLLTGCKNNQTGKSENKLIIGFSQCTMIDEWRKSMIEEMKREISLYRDFKIELIVKDAGDDNNKQINDINELVKQGINLLIVSPNEANQLTQVVEEVYKKGIPVIVIDRKINSSLYTSYIGADNLAIGREAGYFACELLKGRGKVLEITGLKGSTPAIERTKGFHEIIDRYPKIITSKTIEGAWLEKKALEITDSLFRTYSDFNLIFAHNDFMANAASKSSRKYNLKPYIIGVDGLNTSDGGVSMVLNGYIDGTILYPTGGDKAIQLALDILNGKTFEKNVVLNTFRIDKANARTIWLQGQQMIDQQGKIDKQSEQLNNMNSLLNRKNILLLLTYSMIIMLALIVGIVFVSLRHKNHMNKVLDEKSKTINHQNQIITKQRDESINFLRVAEEAKENKLQLFTDLSHEFRTVVTLIKNPIQDILDSIQDELIKDKLKVLQRSSERLARLTDGILKFRKIDENKYHLSIFNANISDFIGNIIETFQEQAIKKNITLHTDIPGEIYAEFDLGVIEKVMYNLLSNAIKFTGKLGVVSVSLKNEDSNIAIKVQDTGIGIPKGELPFLFNRFYRVSSSKYKSDSDTIGIGLALSKELIQLLGGQITVDSIENQGSTFFVTIPKYHRFKNVNNEGELKYLNSLGKEPVFEHNNRNTILIVEDNPDLLMVIADIIGKCYKVITARNGNEGLILAKNELPDLILSDILMPVMDGMQMCIEIKKHHATCHIPVILLTAIDSEENNIKGFSVGADAYITKPFNEYILLSNIKNLIESREKLKEYFSPTPQFRELLNTKNIEDKEFIKKCLDHIFENIENENFTLTNLSERMNLSRSSLYRRIREVTCIKPVDFIKKAKLNYAAKLILSNNNHTINEISWKSGFSDPKYFSKCFMLEFGINPSHFSEEFIRRKSMNL